MANPFFSPSGTPSTGAQGSSSAIRSELALIQAGFDLILTSFSGHGGKLMAVNAGASALEAITTTGTGSGVRATSPTFVTPLLGTPTSGVLTNCTGLPISSGVSGLGASVATLLATFSSTNLAAAVTDETGSGALVFATSPVFTTPNIGTPSAGVLTSCTGLPISSGVSGLGASVATFLATPSSANLRAALTDETGTGAAVFATSPVFTTPDIGSATGSISGNAATVTTNANLTGHVTSVGNAAVLGSFTLAQLSTAVSDANIARTDTGQTFTGDQTFSTTADATFANFHQARNTGGTTVAISILDDRGFSGINSGETLRITTRNDGLNDTGAILTCRTTGGSESLRFWVGIDGNVGIGITPDTTLHAYGSVNSSVATRVENASATATASAMLELKTGANLTQVYARSASHATPEWGIYTDLTASSFKLWNNNAVVLTVTAAGAATFGSTLAVTGALTAASYNGNTITTGTGVLTLAAGKTLTASNTLTLSGTDGTSLNINAVATLNQNTYTPTLTAGANIAASTVRLARWFRVGNVVHVAGELDLDPTAGGGASTDFTLSLPVASNLASVFELSGAGGFYWGDVDAVVIYGDVANDTARFAFQCDSANNSKLTYQFSYLVI